MTLIDLTERDKSPPLLEELLAQQVDLPPPPSFDQAAPIDDGKGKVAAQNSTGSGEKKIPKWLKMGSAHCLFGTDSFNGVKKESIEK